MIRLNDVTKVYPNGSKGVEGLNLHIKKGDIVFVNAGEDKGKTGRVLQVLV